MTSDSDSDYEPKAPRRSLRKVILSSSSESDIPEAGKGWRSKTGRRRPSEAGKGWRGSSPEEEQPAKKLKVKDRHLQKWCPVSGCRAGPQGRLAWHIKVYHPKVSAKLRRHLTRTAKPVKRKPVPTPRPEMTPTLPTLLARMAREKAKAPRAAQPQHVEPVSGTRSFPRFPNSHPEIKKFLQFLRGLDGRRKSMNESLQVATDVSKYLKYASPSSDNPNWLLLLDNRKARGYIDMLNDTGACGASGQLTKLDRLLHALRYLRLEVAADDADIKHRCDIMEERLRQWKAAIRPQKKLQEEKAMATAESDMITLEEATAVIKDKQIRLDVAAAISNVAVAGEGADTDDIKLILAFLLTLLAYRSWQRPGAVTNATLEEFGATTEAVNGGEVVHVMKVGRHKTAREGPAFITMSQSDKRLVLRYVKHVRPKCDVYGEAKVLFVSESGEPISHMNQRLQWLATKYDIRVPSCTTLRTVAATASARELNPQDRLLISSHMAHSEKVHKKYYERLQSSQQAAVAFKIRERMIEGTEMDSDESEPMPKKQESSTNKVEPPKQAPKAKQAPKVRHRREYSEKELSLIKRWIKEDLKDRPSATLAECRSFLKRHPMEGTAKNIQDKVAQLQRKL